MVDLMLVGDVRDGVARVHRVLLGLRHVPPSSLPSSPAWYSHPPSSPEAGSTKTHRSHRRTRSRRARRVRPARMHSPSRGPILRRAVPIGNARLVRPGKADEPPGLTWRLVRFDPPTPREGPELSGITAEASGALRRPPA